MPFFGCFGTTMVRDRTLNATHIQIQAEWCLRQQNLHLFALHTLCNRVAMHFNGCSVAWFAGFVVMCVAWFDGKWRRGHQTRFTMQWFVFSVCYFFVLVGTFGAWNCALCIRALDADFSVIFARKKCVFFFFFVWLFHFHILLFRRSRRVPRIFALEFRNIDTKTRMVLLLDETKIRQEEWTI